MTDEWKQYAACKGKLRLFYPREGDPVRTYNKAAKAICGTCLVRPQCLGVAVERPEGHGTWGGLTEEERRRLSRGQKVQAVALLEADRMRRAKSDTAPRTVLDTVLRHGTRSAYTSGCRCEACTLAERRYSRERRAINRERARERAADGIATREEVACDERTIARRMPDHGTRARYLRGCKCSDCKGAHSAYNEKSKRAREKRAS